MLRTLGYRSSQEVGSHWAPYREIAYLVIPPNIALTDDGREVKGNYQAKWELSQKNGKQLPKDFAKTSNAAITEAAYQIALASQALLHQTRRNQELLASGKVEPMPPYRQVFLPLIVTTANLWICQFPAEKVNIITGEIPFSEVQYKTEPYLFYTYALPPILQFHPGDNQAEYRSDAKWEELARFYILVVQSSAFPDLLTHLSGMTKDDNGGLVLSFLS
jgi:hypothetical protein